MFPFYINKQEKQTQTTKTTRNISKDRCEYSQTRCLGIDAFATVTAPIANNLSK